MLGGLPLSDTAIPLADQGQIVTAADHTAASQRLIYDDLTVDADFLESFAIGLREAARRDDRARVHSYLTDIVQCVSRARDAYGRIAALAKLGGQR
jgi:hypothetical protein